MWKPGSSDEPESPFDGTAQLDTHYSASTEGTFPLAPVSPHREPLIIAFQQTGENLRKCYSPSISLNLWAMVGLSRVSR